MQDQDCTSKSVIAMEPAGDMRSATGEAGSWREEGAKRRGNLGEPIIGTNGQLMATNCHEIATAFQASQ